jgi:hypothetical protein
LLLPRLPSHGGFQRHRGRRRQAGVRSCPSVDVGRRHCACRQGTLAPGRAGVVRRSLWGRGAPKPLPAETDCWSSGLLLPGCVPRPLQASPPAKTASIPAKTAGGTFCSPPAPGSRKGGCRLLRRCASPGKATQCNPGGTTSRAGLAALGAPAGAPLTLSSPPGLAAQRQEKHNTNAAATGPYGPGA